MSLCLLLWGLLTAQAHAQDAVRGAEVAALAGCAACHTTEGGAPYAGGHALWTPFGIFYGPNLTQSTEHGLGDWRLDDFELALRHGRSPEGRPYFPSFPYTSYAHLSDADVRDLWVFLQTIPADERVEEPHELSGITGFRFMVRLWKLIYFRPYQELHDPDLSEAWNRGAYLANGPAHCGECHTPRDSLGGLDHDQWLAGSNLPPEFAPNITPTGVGDWSEAELASYLLDGEDPDGVPAGRGMARVIARGTSRLSDADRSAIATYIASLPRRGR
jgi:mono/diheme cytochrome c family protein